MDHLCPVCNGLTSLSHACQRCGTPLADAGRLYDYYGDYSPYRDINDAKLDNGYPDHRNHQCLHTAWCSTCQTEQTVAVQECTPAMLFREGT
ncbi:hypothetical protein [Brevibacillus sp. SAFN-007a]|uniref:hypothetical protein n=1 Tax=Brevibacillus sp. SAFN-007a TaxID=3436862 RepID=UPI003F801892